MRNDRFHTPAGRATLLAALCAAAVAVLLVGAASAPAGIDCDNAPPCWDYYVDGPAHGFDLPTDVALTRSLIWVCGAVQSTDHLMDASLVRIVRESDAEPRLLTWDGSPHGSDVNGKIAVRGSYVYTCGYTANAAGDSDLLLIRWSSSGAVKWAKTYAGSGDGDDIATDVAVDSRGDAIVCGYFAGRHEQDWIVRKYSRSGKKLWTWKYDGPLHGQDCPTEMVVDSDRNVIVTGYVTRTEAKLSAYSVKLSSAGKAVWGRRYDGGSDDMTYAKAICLAPDPKGAVYVAGNTLVTGSDYDGFLLRYGKKGSQKVYARADSIGGPTDESVNDIAVTSDGRIAGAGATGPGGARNQLRVLWDPAGPVLFEDAPVTAGDDEWTAVATDNDRGVYMTGPWAGPSPWDEIATFRWSTGMGGRWWYSWADDDDERDVTAIAVSGMTCVVVGKHDTATDSADQFVHVWTY